MENLEVKVTSDEKLILIIDLTKSCGYTGRFNNCRIATSGGNVQIPTPDGKLRMEKFNITVWRPLTPMEREERNPQLLKGWSDKEKAS